MNRFNDEGKQLLIQLFNDVDWGREEEKEEFLNIIEELLINEYVLMLSIYKQHRNTNRLLHVLHVSYSCFLTCKRHNLDFKSAARAGILHDFCLMDWRERKDFKYGKMWGFFHPGLALEESEKHFKLNKIEKSMILRHMFPLTIIPPLHSESYIIMWWDRYWCIRELITKQKVV